MSLRRDPPVFQVAPSPSLTVGNKWDEPVNIISLITTDLLLKTFTIYTLHLIFHLHLKIIIL